MCVKIKTVIRNGEVIGNNEEKENNNLTIIATLRASKL